MTRDRGKLSKFIAGQPSYFRTECSDFPWHSTDRSVWYALLVVEDGEIARYGFTSSTANKEAMCDAIDALGADDDAMLLGVWTGQYSTHLFVIEPSEAIEHLRGSKRFARFEHMRNVTDVVKTYGPRGGFRHLCFCYTNEDGTPVHTAQHDRSEAQELEMYFKEQDIPITEERSN